MNTIFPEPIPYSPNTLINNNFFEKRLAKKDRNRYTVTVLLKNPNKASCQKHEAFLFFFKDSLSSGFIILTFRRTTVRTP